MTHSLLIQLSYRRLAEALSTILTGILKVKILKDVGKQSMIREKIKITKITSQKSKFTDSIQSDLMFSTSNVSMNRIPRIIVKNVSKETSALKWSPRGTSSREPQIGRTLIVLTDTA